MSDKPKKNKAPKAEKPLDDEFPAEEIEEQPVETAVIDETPKKGDRGKAPADAKKKKSKGFKLSSVDPIILASFTIFMVACLIVTGITVYGIVAGDSSNKPAEYGDSVELYYTGSYFAYYDEEGAVIFDTNMQEVGDSDSYKKSYGYTVKETYNVMTLTVGQGDYLDGFKNALIGHRPGDVVKVEIDDGYGSLTEGVNKFTVAKAGNTISTQQSMTVDDYKSFFGVDDAPEAGFTFYDVDSPYGWKADVHGDSVDMVSVTYKPEADQSYTKNEITYKVNGAVTTEINFDYQIDDFADNAKILKGVYNGQNVFFIESNGADMTYKTTKETVGTKMFFTIKFVGYTDDE